MFNVDALGSSEVASGTIRPLLLATRFDFLIIAFFADYKSAQFVHFFSMSSAHMWTMLQQSPSSIPSRTLFKSQPTKNDPCVQNTLLVGRPDFLSSESTIDANMITWDSPNDPSNPQNWSIKYKWLITIICTVININMYVRVCLLTLLLCTWLYKTNYNLEPLHRRRHRRQQ